MTAKTTTTFVLVLAFVAAYFHALNSVNGASLPVMVKRDDEAGGQQQQPQQECVEECERSGKSTVNCERQCVVLSPVERHVTPLLDADCVRQCQGGEVVSGQNPLKPECEQKCLYKEPSPVVVKKREAADEEPGCKTDCVPSEDGRGKKCTTKCVGKLAGSGGRTTGQLDKACVEECNGGPVTKLDELKPECEQKCAFQGSVQQVVVKKTEFGSKEACLQYCQEKGIGQSAADCDQKCQHTDSGAVQQQQG